MKDKLVFFIALIIILSLLGYLGFVAWPIVTKYFGLSNNNNGNEIVLNKSNIALKSPVNQDVLNNTLEKGEKVTLKADFLPNTNGTEKFEGRVYKVKEMSKFPDFETQIPIEAKTFNFNTVNNQMFSVNFEPIINDCGVFYVSVGQKEYWTSSGKTGLNTYGYVQTNCTSTDKGTNNVVGITDNKEASGSDNFFSKLRENQSALNSQFSTTTFNNNQDDKNNVPKGDSNYNSPTTSRVNLKPKSNTNITASTDNTDLANKAIGTVKTNNTVDTKIQTESTDQLPKAGAALNLTLLGIVSLLVAYIYKKKFV